MNLPLHASNGASDPQSHVITGLPDGLPQEASGVSPPGHSEQDDHAHTVCQNSFQHIPFHPDSISGVNKEDKKAVVLKIECGE